MIDKYNPPRCVGKEVPFGSEYVEECKTCLRSQNITSRHAPWIGPVKFVDTCKFKYSTQ